MQSADFYSNAQAQVGPKDPEASQQPQQAHRGVQGRAGSGHEPAGQLGRDGLQGAADLDSAHPHLAAAERRRAAYGVPATAAMPGGPQWVAPPHGRITRIEHMLEPQFSDKASGTEQLEEDAQARDAYKQDWDL